MSELKRMGRKFLALEAAPGLVLIAAAVHAMIAANVPVLQELYRAFLQVPMELRIGPLSLDKNLLLVINDGLMAIFFLLVGLEIKREIAEGELSSPSRMVLPAAAAVGGVVAPALIYAFINWGDSAALNGWAIPAATDIAFALGMLALLGSRVPLSLKVFLTTVAVIDDLAAILIIATLYTANLSVPALMVALVGVVMLVAFNRLGIASLTPYFLVGIMMWVALIKSGVHATLAGVVVAIAIPVRATTASNKSCTPLANLEHRLHPWVAFFIMPLFAFANAGVALPDLSVDLFLGGVSSGITLGLLLGKPIGIVGTAAILVGLGLAKLPDRTNWASFVGVSFLAGIGFTMSLFIGTLAFDEQGLHNEVATRVGVFTGSALAGLCGLALLAWALPAAEGPGKESHPSVPRAADGSCSPPPAEEPA